MMYECMLRSYLQETAVTYMDAFNDIPSFKRFVGYYRLIQTPRDVTMRGCALTPALSDANWETVWEATLDSILQVTAGEKLSPCVVVVGAVADRSSWLSASEASDAPTFDL